MVYQPYGKDFQSCHMAIIIILRYNTAVIFMLAFLLSSDCKRTLHSFPGNQCKSQYKCGKGIHGLGSGNFE